jgi:D-serine deaminase-like pyridoxal phosphate-dependent protein
MAAHAANTILSVFVEVEVGMQRCGTNGPERVGRGKQEVKTLPHYLRPRILMQYRLHRYTGVKMRMCTHNATPILPMAYGEGINLPADSRLLMSD